VRRYALFAVALLVAAVCVRLGLWQLDRLGERRDRNAVRQARLEQPALDVSDGAPADTAAAYRRAVARGAFDYTREVILVGRSRRGVPGVYLVTPLRLAGGSALLVERGWVPSPDARTAELSRYREGDSATVEGVLLEVPSGGGFPEGARETDRGWPLYLRRAAPAELRERYPYPLAGLVLRRAAVPPGALPELRPVPLPELDDGPHLSYALQWFSFAVIAVVGSAALALRERRGSRDQSLPV
jgi:surfeit locus 1 family protein